ncbi:MAG TPA: hypothetical protein GX519_07895 [Thermoanaerobacterales bacterium]|nr:hypothetical protein [Thermoanaerobacterales bacterium]
MSETSTPYYINEDGIVALALCILKRWTIEQAFNYLETGKKPSKRNRGLTAEDAKDIRALIGDGVPSKEVASMYGISLNYVYKINSHLRLKGG